MRFAATANTKSRVRAAIAFGHLPAQSHTIKPFGAIDDFLETQKATAKTQRERLNSTENVCTSSNAFWRCSSSRPSTHVSLRDSKRRGGSEARVTAPSTWTLGAEPGSEAVQTVAAPRGRREDADGVWRRTCRPPLVTLEEQQPLFRTAEANPEWDHVDCAGILAANTSTRGVEVKHVRDEQTRDPAERFCLRGSRSHKLAIA